MSLAMAMCHVDQLWNDRVGSGPPAGSPARGAPKPRVLAEPAAPRTADCLTQVAALHSQGGAPGPGEQRCGSIGAVLPCSKGTAALGGAAKRETVTDDLSHHRLRAAPGAGLGRGQCGQLLSARGSPFQELLVAYTSLSGLPPQARFPSNVSK